MTAHLTMDFEPVSGLVFRDARPFQAGEASVARALAFPPPPGPFWSAAREVALRTNPKTRVAATGLALVQDGVAYFPAPHDLLSRRDSQGWVCLAPRRHAHGATTDTGLGPLDVPPGLPGKALDGSFLSSAQWCAYLTDTSPGKAEEPGQAKRASDFCDIDARVGNQLDGRTVKKDGGLYSEQVLYLKRRPRTVFRLGLVVTDWMDGSMHTTVGLGGESKIASVNVARLTTPWDGGFGVELRDKMEQRLLAAVGPDRIVRVKLCTLTPAIHSANINLLYECPRTPAWRPFWMFERNAWLPGGEKHSHRIRLVAANVGRATALGFWDGSAVPDDPRAGPGGPKPLYRSVPAGAVYYIELMPAASATPEQALDEFMNLFWFKSLLRTSAGKPTFFGRMGFGVTVVGGWSYV